MSQRSENTVAKTGVCLASACPLAVGVVSRNSVDAAIELAYRERTRIMLLASRRQVEMPSLGGGYVNGWTTRTFAAYVRKRDPEGLLLLCRDHGGPWQHPSDSANGRSEEEVLETAFQSFREDIDAGFFQLHIDASFTESGALAGVRDEVRRTLDLYRRCLAYARKSNSDVIFEFGGEDTTGQKIGVDRFFRLASSLIQTLNREELPLPHYLVGPTGTKVREDRNVGVLNRSKNSSAAGQVEQIARICRDLGTRLKAHNCDYLSDDTVEALTCAGVDTLNVAPEFGIVETRTLIDLFETHGLDREKELFLKLAYDSRKWVKWMMRPTQATDFDRAVIAGHYVFSSPDFRQLHTRLSAAMERRRESLDGTLRKHVLRAMKRYVRLIERAGQQTLAEAV